MFEGLFRQMPWHVNLLLRITTPEPPAAPGSARDTAILLYSWNKAGLLADTLASLAASHIDGALIVVLDNGSDDDTASVIEKSSRLFPEGAFESVRLPVNVGAPAARNWLLALPRVREREFAAFLDDDILLPPDWLVRLRATLLNSPQAGVAGCKITDATTPFAVQSADYNLLPLGLGEQGFRDLPEHVHAFDNAGGEPDFGQYEYSRPCLSVSGCCHLLRMAAVREAGGFDIAFTPSQFDDFERDLRSALAGMPAVYTHAPAIRHVQHSSLKRATTLQQAAQVFGNKVKLAHMYGEEEAARLVSMNYTLMGEDLLRRVAAIAGG
jgi:GT2 family glycosyltransferase